MSFTVIARAATPDSFLVFFSTLAMLLFVAGTAKARVASGEPNERNAPWAGQTRFEPSWASCALIYAAMGCGVLTKGPIGVVLPTAVIGLFLLVDAGRADRTAGRRCHARRTAGCAANASCAWLWPRLLAAALCCARSGACGR